MPRGTFVAQAEEYGPTQLLYYLLASLILAAGVVVGALALRTLTPAELAELNTFIERFLAGLDMELQRASGRAVLRESLSLELKTLGLIYVLGLTVLGLPGVIAVVFIRGFVLGFTVGFLVYQRGLGGVLFTLAAVVPQNLFLLPALIFASVCAFRFSLQVVRSRRPGWKVDLWSDFLGYSALMTAAVAAATGGSLVKAYVAPVLMSLVKRLLM